MSQTSEQIDLAEALDWLDYCLGETAAAMEAVQEAMKEGGHTGQPLQEPESIIRFAIDRAIKETPDLVLEQMVALMRKTAHLEAELYCLRLQLLGLGRGIVNL